VALVVEPHVFKAATLAQGLPKSLKVHVVRPGLDARQDIGIAVDARER
jgi:hypothetical protein